MVQLGKVVTPALPDPLSPTGSRMCMVALADGRVVDARVAHLGQGLGRGAFWTPLPADEVLVFMPDGDPNSAVVFAGLGSAAAPNPLANAGAKALLMHPAGIEHRSVDGLPAHGVVIGPFLAALLPYLTALEAFVFTCSTAATAANIAAAAVTFMAAVQKAGAAPSSFAAQLTTSSAAPSPGVVPGVGGAPFASPTTTATL